MPYTWKLTEIGPRRITLSVTLSRYMEDGFDSDALPGSLTRPESPASSVRHDSVSAGKRKRSISHSPTRDLRLWSGGGPTRLLAEWMMKDVYDFPLSVNVDNISSAYGSKAWCWGEACSWFEEYSFRVNDRSHWGLMDDG